MRHTEHRMHVHRNDRNVDVNRKLKDEPTKYGWFDLNLGFFSSFLLNSKANKTSMQQTNVLALIHLKISRRIFLDLAEGQSREMHTFLAAQLLHRENKIAKTEQSNFDSPTFFEIFKTLPIMSVLSSPGPMLHISAMLFRFALFGES